MKPAPPFRSPPCLIERLSKLEIRGQCTQKDICRVVMAFVHVATLNVRAVGFFQPWLRRSRAIMLNVHVVEGTYGYERTNTPNHSMPHLLDVLSHTL